MKEYGKVSAVQGKKADVIIQRSAMCGDCGACQIGREKMTMETMADNPVKAKPGELVAVEMNFMSLFQASMIAYGIPLIMLVVGFGLGWILAPNFGTDQILTSFWCGIIFVALTYWVIHLLEKRGYFKGKYHPVITEILPDDYQFPTHSACKN